MDVLLDRIAGNDERTDVVLDTPPLLVERASTAATSLVDLPIGYAEELTREIVCLRLVGG